MTALLGVGPSYADKGLPSASLGRSYTKAAEAYMRPADRAGGRGRLWPGGWPHCSLEATLKAALGKHAHPGLSCQRQGPPQRLLALPGA